MSTRRAALLTTGAGLALAGLVTLLVIWVGLVTATLRTGLAEPGTCVAAATDGQDGAAIGSTLLPPRAVCTWEVDGVTEETVLAQGPAGVATAAVVAGGAGVLLVLGTVLAPLVRRARPGSASAVGADRPAGRDGSSTGATVAGADDEGTHRSVDG